MKSYQKENIPFAKQLRKEMTPWERKLWYEYLRSYPVRFQRQKAIDRYIIDFYCAKARICIELDGGGHYTLEQQDSDQMRTAQLKKQRLQILRFTNLEVDQNFEEVCKAIDLAVKASL